MSNTLDILQLNVGKRSPVQLSLLNDEQLKDYGILAVQEPHAWKTDGTLIVAPLSHSNWTKIIPTTQADEGWGIRSMLWVRKDLEIEQISVDSPDIAAILMHLPGKELLVASIYVPGGSARELRRSVRLLQKLVREVKLFQPNFEILFLGDFNRHDQLWVGDDVTATRQGEADPIIDLMGELGLQSLLGRGVKTWQRGDSKTTIDLVLASEGMVQGMIKCRLHDTEHGSDHRAIESSFDIELPSRPAIPRLLFKNAPWNAINERIAETLRDKPPRIGVQDQADQLLKAVQDAVSSLTPTAKPSPYAKRWWTADLTHLRKVYTHWRNRARGHRRAG
jgi:exonuclease III